jgi:hypothetical protein
MGHKYCLSLTSHFEGQLLNIFLFFDFDSNNMFLSKYVFLYFCFILPLQDAKILQNNK